MKTGMLVLYGVGLCAGVAAGIWLSTGTSGEGGGTVAQPVVSAASGNAAAAGGPGRLWSWGGVGNAGNGPANEAWDALLAQALKPSYTPAAGNDAREKLRQLAQDDPAVLQQLLASYDKENHGQTRQLIIALLSGVEKPEVLAFSGRLALSRDMAQRKDGFSLLQSLGSDSPVVRSIILQGMSGDKPADAIMLALAALRPPGGAQPADTPAIVAQLQKLSTNVDPEIRRQSILQLAEWDRAGISHEQWAQALADQSPLVRAAAVTAVAQAGNQSASVRAALLRLANDPNENRDVRGNALQVLEGFVLDQGEAADVSRLRAQLSGA